MKRIAALFSLAVLLFLSRTSLVFAQDASPSPAPTEAPTIFDLSYKINDLPVGDDPSLTSKLYTDPETRIDGNTRIVWVQFTKLDPKLKYAICSGFEKSSCNNNFSPQSDGTITLSLCGAGSETAKGVQVTGYKDKKQISGTPVLKGTCDETRDYFHEDHKYKISLWANYESKDDRPDPGKDGNEIIPARFYVNRSYPLVKINSKDPGTQTTDITLWGRRPQSDEDNNYQVVVEGLDHDYKKEQCFTVPKNGFLEGNNNTVGINTQWVPSSGTDATHPDHILEGTGFSVPKRDDSFGNTHGYGGNTHFDIDIPFTDAAAFEDWGGDQKVKGPMGIGSYIVKINERISDSRPLGLGNNCEGGFTYMHIFFDIAWKDQSQGKQEIVIRKVIYDPKRTRSKIVPPPPDIPCAEGEIDEKKGTCKAFNVALLGKIPLDPVSFIKSVYTIVLSFAGIAAMAIIIRAGYKFMYSRGDKEVISQARSQLTSAVIGLTFIILAYVILSVIGVDILKIPGFG